MKTSFYRHIEILTDKIQQVTIISKTPEKSSYSVQNVKYKLYLNAASKTKSTDDPSNVHKNDLYL